jgi:SPX domain protein involved in polyphosphate accumulation
MAASNACPCLLPLLQVRDFIYAHAASLSTSLEALAAAAPHLAQQNWQQLESQAQQLGQQLLALEQYIHLNQTGFVKIIKKHDKVHRCVILFLSYVTCTSGTVNGV